MMVHEGPVAGWKAQGEPSALTIGVLDGVHRGHRALIGTLQDGMVSTVLTFDPHPVEVLRPGTPPRLITTISERLSLLEAVGVQQVGVLDLDEIRDLSPAEFVETVLVDKLNVGRVVVGPDFRFGRDRSGDTSLLENLGKDSGFETRVIELVTDPEGVISSSRIRTMIEAGQVGEAADSMASRFKVTNRVVTGDSRGREIGFPTANLTPPVRKVVPAIGVYAAYAEVSGEVERAAVNVGVRPTFGGGELIVEAYILDFDADIYGRDLTIEFVEYLRPELGFETVDELVEAIEDDVTRARRVLEATTPSMG